MICFIKILSIELFNIQMITGLVTSSLLGISGITKYIEYKRNIKIKSGIEKEIEYSNNQLNIEKEKLKKLLKEKSKLKELSDFCVKKVNDEEKVKDFKNKLFLSFNVGYNEYKYLNYYNKNILEQKLNKEFNAQELEFMKEYVTKDKVKKLVLSRKK